MVPMLPITISEVSWGPPPGAAGVAGPGAGPPGEGVEGADAAFELPAAGREGDAAGAVEAPAAWPFGAPVLGAPGLAGVAAGPADAEAEASGDAAAEAASAPAGAPAGCSAEAAAGSDAAAGAGAALGPGSAVGPPPSEPQAPAIRLSAAETTTIRAVFLGTGPPLPHASRPARRSPPSLAPFNHNCDQRFRKGGYG
jgi:hypothetical protein